MPLGKETLPGGYPTINATTSIEELIEAVSKVPKPEPPDTSSPASENPAVARCCQAHAQALNAATKQRKDNYASAQDAAKAYRNAMPPLSGPENIRDFIACVAHGMLLETISGTDGARLLYAAQVAHSALSTPASPNKGGRPSSESNKKSHPEPEPTTSATK